jgi:hypothetical protein
MTANSCGTATKEIVPTGAIQHQRYSIAFTQTTLGRNRLKHC